MNSKIKGASFLLLIALLPFALRAQLAINSSIPDLKLYRFSDNSAFNSSHIEKGKKSIVLFFDATCDHCQNEVAAIGKRYADFKDVNFYLVSMDEKEQVEWFMNGFGKELKGKKNVTVLLDPERTFLPVFLPNQYPGIYIYSADMKLIWHKDGQRDVNEILAGLKP